MKQSIKQSRLLEKTAKHYNNLNRNTDGGLCYYFPRHENTEGCAIGRLIKDKQLCKRLDENGNSAVGEVFNRLPKYVKQYGKEFLSRLQELHDTNVYWYAKGLTPDGKKEVKRIKAKFSLK
jgi:hypothetical protein